MGKAAVSHCQTGGLDECVASAEHPLFRAHCFAALRNVCFGLSIAVIDDMPEDQGAILLHGFDILVKLEKPDDATLLGLYVLKLNEEVSDIESVASAAPAIRDYVLQCNLEKLTESVPDGTDDELWQMANDETDAILADMTYDPVEVLTILRDIHLQICSTELQGEQGNLRLAASAVDLEDLFRAAHERYDVIQLQAARAYAGLLSTSTATAVAQTLCQEHDGPRMLAFLCVSEHPLVSKVASRALSSFIEALKGTVTLAWMIGFGRGGQTSATGVLEAAVYLLSSDSTLTSQNGALVLMTLARNDKACVEAMKRLGKQLGPALLDHILGSTNEDLLTTVAGLIFHVFGVKDEASIVQFAETMIPEISPDDLEFVRVSLLDKLESSKKKPLKESVTEQPPVATPVAAPVPTASATPSKPIRKSVAAVAPEPVKEQSALVFKPVAVVQDDDDDDDDVNRDDRNRSFDFKPEPEPVKKAPEPEKPKSAPPTKKPVPLPAAAASDSASGPPKPKALPAPGAKKALPPQPPKKALPAPKAKPKEAAVVPPPAEEPRRGRGYTQQIEAKFAQTDVGKTLRLDATPKPVAAAKKPMPSRAPPTGPSSGPKKSLPPPSVKKPVPKPVPKPVVKEPEPEPEPEPVVVSKGEDEDEEELEVVLSKEALEEIEHELIGADSIDESHLTDRDWLEIEELVDTNMEDRVIQLFKLGAVLDGQVVDSVEVDDLATAEELLDQAICKFQALLLLKANCHRGLRRLAQALVRKAEFRSGDDADFVYGRAISTYDQDIAAWPDVATEAQQFKALALIDRAKNKAAQEDASGGTFTRTRKLLAEAKLVAKLASDPTPLEEAIEEVLNYCRVQTESRKKVAAPAAKPLPGPKAISSATTPSKPLPKMLPKLAKDKSSQRMSMGPTASREQAASPLIDKKPRPVSTDGAAMDAKKTGSVPVKVALAAPPAAKANPKALVREGSVQKKDGPKSDEKERLQLLLDAKKPVIKVGKLNKEGGGKSLLGRKNWKERLFELSESALEYYEKSNQDESPLGSVSLYEVVETKPVNVPGKEHCFELVTKTRVFQIQAQSSVDRDEWIKAIRNNCERQGLMKAMLGLK